MAGRIPGRKPRARWPAAGARPRGQLERAMERVALGYGVWEQKITVEEDGKAESAGKGAKRVKHEFILRYVPPDIKMQTALMRAREGGGWGNEALPRLVWRIPRPGGGYLGGEEGDE